MRLWRFLKCAVSDQALRWPLLLPLALAAGAALTLHPCESAGQGGVAIDPASGRLTLRMAEKQNGRAWTQPLYENRPRQPKPTKPADPPKTEPPGDPTPSGDTPAQ